MSTRTRGTFPLDAGAALIRVAPAGFSMPDASARLAAFGTSMGSGSIDPSLGPWFEPDGTLVDVDELMLAEWWVSTCWMRRLVWAAASTGSDEAVDWLAWVVENAAAGGYRRFAGVLARDLLDVGRVVVRTQCGTARDGQHGVARSSNRIFAWLQRHGVRPAFCAGDGRGPTGSGRVTGAWLGGATIDPTEVFDALMIAGIQGSRVLVVELRGQLRPLALCATESDGATIDGGHIGAVDLVRRRGGWLSSNGVWCWDTAKIEPLAPIGVGAGVSPFDAMT